MPARPLRRACPASVKGGRYCADSTDRRAGLSVPSVRKPAHYAGRAVRPKITPCGASVTSCAPVPCAALRPPAPARPAPHPLPRLRGVRPPPPSPRGTTRPRKGCALLIFIIILNIRVGGEFRGVESPPRIFYIMMNIFARR